MKIALCFYGQPRFYKSLEITHFLKTIKESNHEIDVYMHLWKPKSKKDYLRSPWTNIDPLLATIDDYENLEESIKKIYLPVEFELEDERNLLNSNKKFQRTPHTSNPEIVYRVFYSLHKVADLLKNSAKTYDIVLRMRTDSAPMNLPQFEKLIGDRIWVPDTIIYHPNLFDRSVSVSSQDNFYKIAEIYPKIEELYETCALDMTIEYMMKAHLENEGLLPKIKKNRFVNFGLVRGETPRRLCRVWLNEEFHQNIQLQDQNMPSLHPNDPMDFR